MDTLNQINLFNNEIKKSFLIHIPHSSLHIPKEAGYIVDEETLQKEMLKLTDIGTDVIFNLGEEFDKLVFEYNRVYCDVERLPDEFEPMYQLGRGFYYTKTDSGEALRSEIEKDEVLKIFNEYHKKFTNIIDEKLNDIGSAIIIDCHSFSDVPFDSDLIKQENRPDICLGVDSFHTPRWLVEFLEKQFKDFGFSVKINNPYSGTIVPLKHYGLDNRVQSIMIEINRKLFIEDNKVDYQKLIRLNNIIKKIFEI